MKESTIERIVTLTDGAIQKVKSFIQEDPSLQGKNLRVLVEQGGCSGHQYGFTFDAQKEGDSVLTFDGLTVLVDAESGTYLRGSVIDFKQDVQGSGFVIQNPNVKKSCGCGHSFES